MRQRFNWQKYWSVQYTRLDNSFIFLNNIRLLNWSWDYYTETGHFRATRIIELPKTHGASRDIFMQINWIASQNQVEHPVCVGSGVVVVNTGVTEVTRLLNEALAENPFHRSLRSQCMICMVRHTNNTFSWPQKMLPTSWPDMFNCRIICCDNIFGQSAVITRSMPDTIDFF